MPLDQRTVNNLGYISITAMMAMLLLLWFRVVPDSFAVPFLLIALALFIARIIFRLKLIRKEREALRARKDVDARSQHENRERGVNV